METETKRGPRPFPPAPDFTATNLDRALYRSNMREAWLDRADQYLTNAREAASAGNYVGAEVDMARVHDALTQARNYRDAS